MGRRIDQVGLPGMGCQDVGHDPKVSQKAAEEVKFVAVKALALDRINLFILGLQKRIYFSDDLIGKRLDVRTILLMLVFAYLAILFQLLSCKTGQFREPQMKRRTKAGGAWGL